MPTLFSCSELNELRATLFPENLQHLAELLQFVPKKRGMPTEQLFQELASGSISTDFCTLLAEPIKGNTSVWQRYWLNSFLMHWVLLLHKHRLHLLLSEQNTALNLSKTGKIKGFYVNVSFTPIHQIAHEGDFYPAYLQLQRFLVPIITVLTEHSGLNARVFWHNAANVIEFSLKMLEQQGFCIENSIQMLFKEKKWGYGWNPFYNAVEYVNFPALPLAQPMRFRKVCCHRHLIENVDYCIDCPKLKKLSGSELSAYCQRIGLTV